MLRATKPLRFLRRECRGNGAIFPRHAALGRLISRATHVLACVVTVTGPTDGQKAGLALDHDVPGVGAGCRYKSNSLCPAPDLITHPFRAGPRLAETSAGEHKPRQPIAVRLYLFGTRDEPPIVQQRLALGVSESG